MKNKFTDGDVTLKIITQPIETVEIYHNKKILFATNNPKTLLSISKVISDLAQALNEEQKK